MALEPTITDLYKLLTKIIPVLSVLSVTVNCFHVIVLTRKSVTSSSMNTFLVGIAIVDILAPIVYVKQGIWWLLTYWRDFCYDSEHVEVVIDLILLTFNDTFRRCSTWLGLLLAGTRTVSVKLASRKSCDFITESKFGWRVFLITVLLSSFVSISYLFRFQISLGDPHYCLTSSGTVVLTSKASIVEILHEDDNSDGIARQIHLFLTGVLGKLVPSFLFPIFAIILVYELSKYEDNSSAAKTEKISKMVIYMTVSFVVTELPIGIFRLINATQTESTIFFNLNKILNYFYVPITMSHCFICFSLSSQYRITALRLLGLKPGITKLSAGFAVKTPTLSMK